jgi:hypothetical protein
MVGESKEQTSDILAGLVSTIGSERRQNSRITWSRVVFPESGSPAMQRQTAMQIQALDCSQPLLPMRPGQAERRTHDYVRHGTTSLFAALDVQSGRVLGDFHPRHRSVEFRKFLDRIDTAVPGALDVY